MQKQQEQEEKKTTYNKPKKTPQLKKWKLYVEK